MEASLPTALQTHVCLVTVHVDQTLLAGLFVATAASIFDKYLSVSLGATVACPTPQSMFFFLPPSIPDYFRATGKLRESHSESISNYIQKDWFP